MCGANKRSTHEATAQVGSSPLVRGKLRDGLYEVDRAFPAGGAGVVRNTENGRIEAGLSKRKKWKTGGEHHG